MKNIWAVSNIPHFGDDSVLSEVRLQEGMSEAEFQQKPSFGITHRRQAGWKVGMKLFFFFILSKGTISLTPTFPKPTDILSRWSSHNIFLAVFIISAGSILFVILPARTYHFIVINGVKWRYALIWSKSDPLHESTISYKKSQIFPCLVSHGECSILMAVKHMLNNLVFSNFKLKSYKIVSGKYETSERGVHWRLRYF